MQLTPLNWDKLIPVNLSRLTENNQKNWEICPNYAELTVLTESTEIAISTEYSIAEYTYLCVCRTLPVVSISITPSSNPTFAIVDIDTARSAGLTSNLSVDGQPEREYAFFRLNFPVSYSSNGESPPSIRLNLTINSDTEQQSSRVFFLQSGTISSRYFRTEVALTRDTVSPLTTEVYIRVLDLCTQAFTFDFSYSVANLAPLDFNSSVFISNPSAVPIFSVCLVVIITSISTGNGYESMGFVFSPQFHSEWE